jgi:hypothetical protein
MRAPGFLITKFLLLLITSWALWINRSYLLS